KLRCCEKSSKKFCRRLSIITSEPSEFSQKIASEAERTRNALLALRRSGFFPPFSPQKKEVAVGTRLAFTLEKSAVGNGKSPEISALFWEISAILAK
ncbi:MAG: hypothetical protein RR540_08505, partial [Oscillospiraceae bacterium]